MNEILNRAWLAKTGSPTAKLVLAALADHANANGYCYPSITRLAARCEVDRRTAMRAIRLLEQQGHIRAERKSGVNTSYIVNPTGDTESPVPQSHQCHTAPPPVTLCPPTRVTESPPPVTLCPPNRKEPSVNPKEQGEQPPALQVELPAFFPKDEAAAAKHASAVGCPVDFAVQTWTKAMGRGGRDARDVLIRNFRWHLASEWSYQRERAAKQPAPQKPNHSKGF